MADRHTLLLRGVQHHQVFSAAPADARTHQDWQRRAGAMHARHRIRLHHRPRLAGGVAGQRRHSFRTPAMTQRGLNLLRREGARIEALVRQDQHVAIRIQRGQLQQPVTVHQKLPCGHRLHILHRQRFQLSAAADRVRSMKNHQLPAGHDRRIRNRIAIEIRHGDCSRRAGQLVRCADAQSRRTVAHNGEPRALRRLITHQQRVSHRWRSRPIRRQRRDAARNLN